MVVMNPHEVVVFDVLGYCFGKQPVGLSVGVPRGLVKRNLTSYS